MVIVQCDMCYDLIELKEWKESDILICITCAEILSEIKKRQCFKEKEKFPDGFWLFEFDYMRGLKRDKINGTI